MREYVIAGNWKMNNTPAAAGELINALKPKVKDAGATVVVCVPLSLIHISEPTRRS